MTQLPTPHALTTAATARVIDALEGVGLPAIDVARVAASIAKDQARINCPARPWDADYLSLSSTANAT